MKKTRSAFTLIELLLSITIFALFMGVILSVTLSYHRTQQDLISKRRLLSELEQVFLEITSDILENQIDYEYYNGTSSSSSLFEFELTDALRTDTLALRSFDETKRILYTWEEGTETLTLQEFIIDEEGNASPAPGFEEALLLHSEGIQVTQALFRIFPGENPFLDENLDQDELQFQPMVQIQITFSTPSRQGESLSIEFQTSVTTRFIP